MLSATHFGYDSDHYRETTLKEIYLWNLGQLRTIEAPFTTIATVPSAFMDDLAYFANRSYTEPKVKSVDGKVPSHVHRWEVGTGINHRISDVIKSWFYRHLPKDTAFTFQLLVLGPGGFIKPHVDHGYPTHYVVPLTLPDGAGIGFQSYGTAELETGILYALDTSKEHYAFNHSDKDRKMLSIVPLKT